MVDKKEKQEITEYTEGINTYRTVSYTHLDVYKRQVERQDGMERISILSSIA